MFKMPILNRIIRENIKNVKYKHKEAHWSMQKKKKTATFKALEHFDDFYKQVYASKWEKIRQALLGKPKYIAVVNNFSDNEEIMKRLESRGAFNIRRLFQFQQSSIKEENVKNKRDKSLEKIWKMDKDSEIVHVEPRFEEKPDFSMAKSLENSEIDSSRIINTKNNVFSSNLSEFVPATKIKGGTEDYIPESDHYKYYDNTKFPINIEKEYDLHFPEELNVYSFETESFTEFPHPKKGTTGVYDYYLMDGGSLLPVLALDLKPGVKMLDLCAAPGGKSLIALQTLYPDYIESNDISMSRTKRIYNVYHQYLFDLDEKWLRTGKLKISCKDGRFADCEDNFDRILVDVPCTTDRHSVVEDENNIFRPDRIKERLKLPELQSELLYNALKLVRKGGVVVYSTCSLSPIQNDGVVHMALKRIWQETRIEITVCDLNPALQQVKNVYILANRKLLKYGHLVIPNMSQNYGPTYFCKLKRIN